MQRVTAFGRRMALGVFVLALGTFWAGLLVTERAMGDSAVDRELLEASAYRSPETIADVLARGANPNIEDGNGVTPLINVAARGNARSLLLLLDAGARVDGDGKNGCVALTWAARNGWEKLVETLVERGADINHRDMGGMTPLMRAAWNGKN